MKGILRLPIVKIIIGIILILLGTMLGSAATLDSYNTSPHKIFKCQSSVISANYSNPSDIISLDALLTASNTGAIETLVMSGSGSNWTYTYGNDNTTTWGNKSLTFRVHKTVGYYDNITTGYVFVYSDDCTGSNIQGYRNTSYRTNGFGNYTRYLFSGEKNLIEFSMMPYLDYWGQVIYFLIMFVIAGVIYIKNQNIMQPLIILFITITMLVSSSLIDSVYKPYILLIMGAAMAAIFWRLFKSA